jgi:hypothetical protein
MIVVVYVSSELEIDETLEVGCHELADDEDRRRDGKHHDRKGQP